MVCLPRVYRHRPPEIRGRRDIGKKLLLDRLAVAAHREPRSCGIETQRESSDSRSASWHAWALLRAARQAPGGVSLNRLGFPRPSRLGFPRPGRSRNNNNNNNNNNNHM
jgi:hypothetical protein